MGKTACPLLLICGLSWALFNLQCFIYCKRVRNKVKILKLDYDCFSYIRNILRKRCHCVPNTEILRRWYRTGESFSVCFFRVQIIFYSDDLPLSCFRADKSPIRNVKKLLPLKIFCMHGPTERSAKITLAA